jgi:hypothetical protein
LCFHLNGDIREKVGQIAHLDGDRTNNAEDNLAFLCMEHHTTFDSTTSQHKNYTIDEIKTARNRMYKLIAEKEFDLLRAPQGPYASSDPQVLVECNWLQIHRTVGDPFKIVRNRPLALSNLAENDAFHVKIQDIAIQNSRWKRRVWFDEISRLTKGSPVNIIPRISGEDGKLLNTTDLEITLFDDWSERAGKAISSGTAEADFETKMRLTVVYSNFDGKTFKKEYELTYDCYLESGEISIVN